MPPDKNRKTANDGFADIGADAKRPTSQPASLHLYNNIMNLSYGLNLSPLDVCKDNGGGATAQYPKIMNFAGATAWKNGGKPPQAHFSWYRGAVFVFFHARRRRSSAGNE